ncbi:phosphoribosylaminoimidazolesuccinocarboxamide synthase [Candidatus Endomicrobiellum devescovinae]|jgi:phosphoribosylaminoimidazole-succinocarboxamide synthase|uniref:phosphoribosylaminoimidazolesuccinocarboxamide synthase n=1 Tax=Candidatus Endomicrobiellum devescovinae TaxID=3242322 RepID=UPI00282B0EF9|nr:phosphoribosylaminoimidazolesuccinocarboxamide synthase [Endomicrobium sp.]MDR1434475.1 phosphoribosylaminoimidazolesuccinocarboxamide synthase [Endomicrobium sp.]
MSDQENSINLPLVHKGKVRNVYDLGQSYLIVASDRISAFDHVLPTLIPNKGKVLHKLSMFWFDFVYGIVPNHIITGDFNTFPTGLKKYEYLRDRSMIVKKANRLDIECIVRGYLAGSGWKEYQKSQTVCAIKLLSGLKESSRLPEPIFTPSSKEEGGKHDENISFEETVKRVGKDTAESLKRISIELYKKISDYALTKGIIVADTKLEFGFYDNNLILIDEIFTPDSSRFWEMSKYEEGKPQDSLDKQYIRDYLESINWDKSSPAPVLPKEVVEKTMEKYVTAYEKLTGEIFNV